jgi:DNA-binding phage protein
VRLPQESSKAILRDFIHAMLGFGALAEATGIPVKSLMRMFGPSGNPQAKNLLLVIAYLQQHEGIRLQVKPAKVA